jgi:hypothetical protein
MPTLEKRSWWADWGDTDKVEECLDPSPIVPVVPVVPVVDLNKYQPIIEDLLIFETNKIDIYFIS